MGINFRYEVPVPAGTIITYSMERREDGTYFDFELGAFRPYKDIPQHAVTKKMVPYSGGMTAEFSSAKTGKEYIIRVHNGLGGPAVAELIVVANGHHMKGSKGKGGYPVEPSYRLGKKFVAGKAIEAKYRLTFHGNDGFTVHTATLWEDGTSSCNCPRWTKKTTKERGCPHSQRALSLTANVDETGEQPDPPKPGELKTDVPFRQRRRSVDT